MTARLTSELRSVPDDVGLSNKIHNLKDEASSEKVEDSVRIKSEHVNEREMDYEKEYYSSHKKMTKGPG